MNHAIDKLRADFAKVFKHWRSIGQISQSEHDEQREFWASEIRSHMADKEWMKCCSNHFRQMAAQVDRDRARSKRIADEVREQKRAEEADGARGRDDQDALHAGPVHAAVS